MSFDLTTTTHAKWILAGEHAVLRGSPAIVFPLKDYSLILSFSEDKHTTESNFHGVGENWHIVFRGLLENGYALVGQPTTSITGKFLIDNRIPLGVGLGGSAALSVAIARWFLWKKWIEQDDLYEFSRQLENNFHGDSSGIDIAGSMSDHGLLFKRDCSLQTITQNWQPHLYLSPSDQGCITSQAVNKVQSLHTSNPTLAVDIDTVMQQSVEQAKLALASPKELGLATLIKAIHLAKVCFTRWGLTEGKLNNHMQQIMDAGAIACKPTGSGNGGYVLSLWPEPPPKDLSFPLIKALT
jgi:mevalonate kinase